jgi:hypothetical protein
MGKPRFAQIARERDEEAQALAVHFVPLVFMKLMTDVARALP